MSGVCLSQLQSQPTYSPTSYGGSDVYYPDYETAWDRAACINTLPIPSGRPVYLTMLDCCKGAYGGQISGYCISQLGAPPTTSPTSSDYTTDFWYPGERYETQSSVNDSSVLTYINCSTGSQDYDTPWSNAGCLNSLPLPFSPGDRPTYTTNEACVSSSIDSLRSRLVVILT